MTRKRRCWCGGVFLGSAAWWFLLSLGVSVLRSRLNPSALRWVNRLSGAVVALFGVVALVGRQGAVEDERR